MLSQNMQKFRNSVIHKGKIPTREQAILFGEAVATIISPNLVILDKKCPNGTVMALTRRMRDGHPSISTNQKVRWWNTPSYFFRQPTAVPEHRKEEPIVTVKEWIELIPSHIGRIVKVKPVQD